MKHDKMRADIKEAHAEYMAKYTNDGKCHCDMRTKLVGDGCDICNPELAYEYANDRITDLEAELETARELLRDCIGHVIEPSLVTRLYEATK